MPNIYEIPLDPSPQRFVISLPRGQSNITGAATAYMLVFQYRDALPEQAGGCGWTVDIADQYGNPLACGLPLVTGADLLGQFDYLNLGGHMIVTSDGWPEETPTFFNLGSSSHLWWVTFP